MYYKARSSWRREFAVVAWLVCLALAGAQYAAAEVEGAAALGALGARVEALSMAGECAEVLETLDAAGEAWKRDASLRLVAGRCQVQMERWDAARQNLLAARELDPDLAEVDLYLAIAEYHGGNRAEASAALGRAKSVADRDATQLAEHRCREISSRLEQDQAAMGDAETRVAAARCDIQFGRYPGALANVRAARRLAPDRTDLDLWEGIAEFHLGNTDAAREALERAEVDSDEDRARLMLYRGRVLIEAARREEARETLDRHNRSPLRIVEPVNFFYAANPWPQDVMRGEAKEALERVAQYDSTGAFADEVRSALGEADEARGPWISGAIEFHYDDQVVLLGSGVDTPEEISESGNFELDPAIYVEGGSELFRAGRWSGGLLAAFYGTFPDESNDLDTLYPTISAVVDRHISERTTARSRFDFGYALVNGSDYALTNDVTFELHNRARRWGESTVWTRLYYNVFYDDPEDFPTDSDGDGLCTPPDPWPCAQREGTLGQKSGKGSRRDRTGWGFLFGADWRKALDWNASEVRGGYTYEHFIPDGAEFHNQSHSLDAGFNTALPFGFALDLWGQFIFHSYRNASAYPDPDTFLLNTPWWHQNYRRHDRAWQFSVEIERYILDSLKVWVEYAYVDNYSNRAVFDYERQVVGLGFAAILY